MQYPNFPRVLINIKSSILDTFNGSEVAETLKSRSISLQLPAASNRQFKNTPEASLVFLGFFLCVRSFIKARMSVPDY